ALGATALGVTTLGWAHAAPPSAAAAAPGGVLTVTSAGSALDAAFAAGVRQACGAAAHASVQGLDSATFQRLGQWLADGQDTLLVGLLDDAAATLVLDLLRSAGGRVLEEHHHRVDR